MFRLILSFGLCVALSTFCAGGEAPACSREEILRDWMEQDAGRDRKRCFTSNRNGALEQRIVEKILAEEAGPELKAQFKELVDAGVPGRDPRWKELYTRACEARRAARLRSLLKQTRRLHPFPDQYKLAVEVEVIHL